jgi:hypothetical protein
MTDLSQGSSDDGFDNRSSLLIQEMDFVDNEEFYQLRAELV